MSENRVDSPQAASLLQFSGDAPTGPWLPLSGLAPSLELERWPVSSRGCPLGVALAPEASTGPTFSLVLAPSSSP